METKMVARALIVGALIALALMMMTTTEADASCGCGEVGGGHPYYTPEELDAMHDGVTSRVYVSITETDGDIWLYVLDASTKGYYKAMNVDADNVGGYYTSDELEVLHDNTERMIVTVQETDGDSWSYLKDATTGDYLKAMN